MQLPRDEGVTRPRVPDGSDSDAVLAQCYYTLLARKYSDNPVEPEFYLSKGQRRTIYQHDRQAPLTTGFRLKEEHRSIALNMKQLINNKK